MNKPIPDVDNVVGGVKILICERHRYNLDFPIQKDTFEDVSKKFKLSPKTLQSFDCDHGTFARFYCFGKDRALNGIGASFEVKNISTFGC